MIQYYAVRNGHAEQSEPEQATWIHLEVPTMDELTTVSVAQGLDLRDLKTATDVHEDPRSAWLNPDDHKPGLIVVRYPVVKTNELGYLEYETAPMTLFLLEHKVVTVSEQRIPSKIGSGVHGGHVLTERPEEFALHILWCVLHDYVDAMVQVNNEVDNMQLGLGSAVSNNQLYQIMALQKSLIYFESVLDNTMPVLKTLRQKERYFNTTGYVEWLQSVTVEAHQARTMTGVTERILEQYNTTVSSIVSNNLNIIMKVLTSITIILTIPTVIGGLWGMNVPVPLAGQYWSFWGIIAVTCIICGICAYLLHKKNYL
jgi:magnesium transporter